MAIMAAAAPYLLAAAAAASIGGTIMQARAQAQAGENAKAAANFQAAQLRADANNQMAGAEVAEAAQNKQNEYVLSNAQAAAAAGGGSATDPTVNTVMKTIAGEGRLRSLTDMYQGQSASWALNNQANGVAYSGQNAASAGKIGAEATLVSGASSLFSKYASIDSNPASGSTGTTGGGPLPWQLPIQYQNAGAQSFYGGN
jgi:hypothetical protein